MTVMTARSPQRRYGRPKSLRKSLDGARKFLGVEMNVTKQMYETLTRLLGPGAKMRPWHELSVSERLVWQAAAEVPFGAAIELMRQKLDLCKTIGVPK